MQNEFKKQHNSKTTHCIQTELIYDSNIFGSFMVFSYYFWMWRILSAKSHLGDMITTETHQPKPQWISFRKTIKPTQNMAINMSNNRTKRELVIRRQNKIKIHTERKTQSEKKKKTSRAEPSQERKLWNFSFEINNKAQNISNGTKEEKTCYNGLLVFFA